jgi:RNA polymerase sigma factor (sigma-70 family)
MATLEFNTLLLNNTEFLKPFAINLTRDSEEANDLYQETLYKALSNKDKYNDGTNIRAWLFTIMRNIFINNYRRKSKNKVVSGDLQSEFFINQSQATVSNNAETNISLKEIKKAIKDLPEIFRTPFLLYFDGYKYNEIADLLQEPLGTIKSRIHFARKLLKEQISRN